MAGKDKKAKVQKVPNAIKPPGGRPWGAAYGDMALGVAAFALVLNCAVLVQTAGAKVASRQRGLKDTDKLTQLSNEQRKLDGMLQEKTQVAEAATKSLAEKDQQIVAKDQQITELQTQLAAASTKRAGKGKAAAKKRR